MDNKRTERERDRERERPVCVPSQKKIDPTRNPVMQRCSLNAFRLVRATLELGRPPGVENPRVTSRSCLTPLKPHSTSSCIPRLFSAKLSTRHMSCSPDVCVRRDFQCWHQTTHELPKEYLIIPWCAVENCVPSVGCRSSPLSSTRPYPRKISSSPFPFNFQPSLARRFSRTHLQESLRTHQPSRQNPP